jgi:lambda family phage tail tape measure protein
MSGNEVKIRIGLEKPGVDPGLKETDANVTRVGESAAKAGAAAKPAIDSIGVSAKQTAAALRGVPAQFTDIFTSLQGGQAPLTVLLQQGGQLKDMFGGIGPAARAMGGYVAGMITPLTLAAGSIGALALAYTKGREETAAFSNSLIMAGNAANTSVGQLQSLSYKVAATSGATVGAAAETLAALASSGRVSSQVLEQASRAAVELERVGGAAAAETVKEFEALGKSPVEAVLKLNDQYHFLTGAIYEQIKALSDEGKASEAAALAQETYANAVERRIPMLAQNLGLLEKAWLGIKGGAKEAWDAMLGIGREGSIDAQISILEKEIADRTKKTASKEYHLWDIDTAGQQSGEGLNILQEKLRALQSARSAQAQTAEWAQHLADVNAADLFISQRKEASLSKQERLEREIASIRANAALAGTDEETVRKLIAATEEKYADKKTGSRSSKTADPELEAMLLRSDQARRQRKELEDELKAIEQANEKKARAQQIVTNYNDEAAQTLERIARQNELIGVSEREVKVREALYKVEDAAVEVRKRITEQIKDETDRTAALAAVDADLANKKLLVAEATRQAYDAARTFDAGWSDALTKYKDNASNAADTARNAFSGMADAMEGAIKSFVKNGKVDFKSFGDSVINTLIDIQMQSLRTNVLAPMMEKGGSWLAGLFGAGSSGGLDTGAGSGFDSALWGVNSQHTGGIVGTSEGSGRRFVPSSVFSSARRFHTGGIVGDEVPIIAKRGEGVFTPGQMQAMGGGSVTVNVINNASGTRATQTQRSDGNGNRIIDVMLEQIDAAMADNISRGNGKTPAALESRYGLNRAAGSY